MRDIKVSWLETFESLVISKTPTHSIFTFFRAYLGNISKIFVGTWHEQLSYNICYLFTKFVCKVHIFWEGHKIFRNLHFTFDYSTYSQKYGEDFAKILWLSQNIWILPNKIPLTFRLVLYEDFPKIEQCYHLDYHSRHQYMPKFEAFQSPKIRYVYADVGYLNLHESPRKRHNYYISTVF